MVARPVVDVVVKGAKALSSIGKGVAKAGKVAAIGVGAAAAIGGVALTAMFSGSLDAATAAMEAESKLTQIMKNTMNATQETIQSVLDLAEAQGSIGIIDTDIQTSGMQELGTYVEEAESLKTLLPVMNDMLAQQYGFNASQENAVNIATMMGKVLNGQVGGLSKLGYSFTEAQEKVLKYGTEAEKAATLADVISESVGGMNEALAQTDLGKIKQMENAYGSIKEDVGRVGIILKAQLAGVINKNLPVISKLGDTLMGTITKFADFGLPILDKAIGNVTPMVESALNRIGGIADVLTPILSNVFGGLSESAKIVEPILLGVLRGFEPLIPQLIDFGGSVFETIQQITTTAMPAIESIIATVQNVIPAVLPVLQTVITTIGTAISQAAPVIAGLVAGIGVVVSTLAPIFSTIFTEIGEKVGTVIGFVSERMGFIQDIIGTVAPLIGDVISTAWGVISPVIDIAISVFEILFGVVQKVFPGIQSIIESVWGVVKPLVEGIGSVVSNIAGWLGSVADTITGASGGSGSIGKNAKGDNNWKGGLTWVGENGAELVDLPKGSRILPHKESASFTKEMTRSSVGGSPAKSVVMSQDSGRENENNTILFRIEKYVSVIAEIFAQKKESYPISTAQTGLQKISKREREIGVPEIFSQKNRLTKEKLANAITVTIAKIADTIMIREDADIDKIADAVAKKIVEVAVNMP